MTASADDGRGAPPGDSGRVSVADVVAQATALGFSSGDPDWANLGQGQPEVGSIPGAPPRLTEVEVDPDEFGYGAVAGTGALRAAVADYYNRNYRRGKASKYQPENVAIAQGGRLALGRALQALDGVGLGYHVPDYPAAESMIATHLARLSPHAFESREADGFRVDLERLHRTVLEQGLAAVLLSNPCNPTGQSLRGEELGSLVAICRDSACTLMLDEFYSSYVYAVTAEGDAQAAPEPLSAAAHVGDVDTDPVVIFDGLTKGFRYPGLRIGWAIGPREQIERIARAGAELDGGPSTLAQRAALAVLQPGRAEAEGEAVRQRFAQKRNLVVNGLREMGIAVPAAPDSTFYVWGKLDELPSPLNDAREFLRHGLKEQVVTLPGGLFDLNPGGRRAETGRYRRWVRFSFGPPSDELERGLERLRQMIDKQRAVQQRGETVSCQTP